MKNIYKYKGFVIERTDCRLAKNNRCLFEIRCNNSIFENYIKEAEKRPFITSLKDAKEFVTDKIEYETMF